MVQANNNNSNEVKTSTTTVTSTITPQTNKKPLKMSQHQETTSNPIGSIVVTSIICTTIIIVALYGFSLSYETLKQASDATGLKQADDTTTAAAILQSNATIIVALLTGVIGAGFGGYKIWKRLTTVEHQTNGRTHVRDAQIDALISEIRYLRSDKISTNTDPIILAATKALELSTTNAKPPEAQYTDEERALTAQMLKISEQLSNIRKMKEEN